MHHFHFHHHGELSCLLKKKTLWPINKRVSPQRPGSKMASGLEPVLSAGAAAADFRETLLPPKLVNITEPTVLPTELRRRDRPTHGDLWGWR